MNIVTSFLLAIFILFIGYVCYVKFLNWRDEQKFKSICKKFGLEIEKQDED